MTGAARHVGQCRMGVMVEDHGAAGVGQQDALRRNRSRLRHEQGDDIPPYAEDGQNHDHDGHRKIAFLQSLAPPCHEWRTPPAAKRPAENGDS